MLERIKDIKELVNELLDSLPKSVWTSDSTTFFDPAIGGGQFVAEIERRLRSHGHSDKNIRNRVYGFEYNTALVDLAVNMNKLVGQYAKKPYDKFFEMDDTMKFDVIVGNPPYQSGKGNGSQPIYKDFIEKMIDLSKKDGIVAVISPPGHLSGGNLNQPSKLFEKIKKGDLLKVQFEGVDSHFPGIGSLFSYMIWQNRSYNGVTKINSEIVDISPMSIIPSKFSTLVWDIIKKITNGNSLNSTYRKDVDPALWAVAFKELNHVSNKVGCIKAQVFVPGTYTTAWNFAKTCTTKKEAEHICKYLNGKVASFYNYIIRHNGVIHNGIISRLNVPPMGIIKDEDVYQHFGLTQEEIDYIENAVK
jgi:hypothetical protein